MEDLKLSCKCGLVEGRVRASAVRSGNRLICYCHDCRAFAESLGAEEETLDAHGGSDIFQTSPASVEIEQGIDQVCCLRVTEKGPNRWFAGCCNTPIGNTLGPGLPFIGIVNSFWANKDLWNDLVGPPTARVQTKCAQRLPDEVIIPVGFPLRVTLKIAMKILIWKLSRKGHPHPFFHADGTPVAQPQSRDSLI